VTGGPATPRLINLFRTTKQEDDMKKPARQKTKYERSVDQPIAMTEVEYSGLQEAYDHFNAALFGGKLPDIFITLQRRAHSKGYFSADRFSGRTGKFGRHELSLNPDAFIDRTDEQICSTLAHEQVHAWQQAFGAPSARTYHNREWAAKMKSVGLQPSSTGAVGGKETGQSVTHYIIPDGAFSRAYAKLAAIGWKLNLQSAPRQGPKGGRDSKTPFTCPVCGQNAWGKPDLAIDCHPCIVGKLVDAGIDRSIIDGVQFRDKRLMSAETPVESAPQSYAINPPVDEPVKPKRGRPNGSKNKPKAAPVAAIQSYAQRPTKRKRGRPPGSKNKKLAA
jgi:hypothetical protein